MFYTLLNTNFAILATYKLLSANALNLDQPKYLSRGKGLINNDKDISLYGVCLAINFLLEMQKTIVTNTFSLSQESLKNKIDP